MQKFKKYIVFFFLLLSPTSAFALSSTYYFDLVNINNTGTAGPWAKITLTDSTYDGKDSVHFSVDPLEGGFSSIGNNFGLQTFWFNDGSGVDDIKLGNFNPTDWSYSYSTSLEYGGTGEFGKFEIMADADRGNARGNPLSFDVYSFSGSSVDISDFTTILSTKDYLFAGHIAGYGADGTLSAKFSTDPSPIPEPTTLVLFGCGLVGGGS